MMKRLKRTLRDWLWRKLALNCRLPSGVKVEIRSHGDWYIYNEIFVCGEYDLPLTRLIEAGSASGAESLAVLDLGANVGFFFLRWLHLWRLAGSPGVPPRFFLIEGSAPCCAELRRRLTEQPTNGVNFEVLHNLVGPRTGSATITDSHIYCGNQVTADPKAGTSVPYLDLVELCRGFGSVALVKCDIEGSEEAFIESQAEVLAKTQAIVVELHRDLCNIARCERLLHEAGLTVKNGLREDRTALVLNLRRE